MSINHRVNWGAIFAGGVIGVSSMIFFSLFALATGMGGLSILQPFTASIGFGGACYNIAAAAISFGLGGYCTVRLGGIRDPGRACLHALSTFSVSGALVPFLFTRTFILGSAGFAVAPPPGFVISLGLAWTLFLGFGLSAVAACAGGVQASYRGFDVISGEGAIYDEAQRRRSA